jgi:hypothetical protein
MGLSMMTPRLEPMATSFVRMMVSFRIDYNIYNFAVASNSPLVGRYDIKVSGKEVFLGDPITFTKDNIDQYHF